jgi:diamine N-acetyltransferase
MTITYRIPTQADVPALAALGAETFMDTFGHLYSEADSSAFLKRVHSHEAVAADMANPDTAYQIAENDSGLIAYCKVSTLGMPVTPTGKALELKQIYVREQFTGTGIAQHLMTWALDVCRERGVDEVYLSVFQENIRAQKFYRKFGFEKFAEYEFMVGDQADPEYIFRAVLT